MMFYILHRVCLPVLYLRLPIFWEDNRNMEDLLRKKEEKSKSEQRTKSHYNKYAQLLGGLNYHIKKIELLYAYIWISL